jgi:alditol oxidase
MCHAKRLGRRGTSPGNYDWENAKQLLPRIEEQLAPLDARPHWGNLFTIQAPNPASALRAPARIPRAARVFRPDRKLRNAFLETFLFG